MDQEVEQEIDAIKAKFNELLVAASGLESRVDDLEGAVKAQHAGIEVIDRAVVGLRDLLERLLRPKPRGGHVVN